MRPQLLLLASLVIGAGCQRDPDPGPGSLGTSATSLPEGACEVETRWFDAEGQQALLELHVMDEAGRWLAHQRGDDLVTWSYDEDGRVLSRVEGDQLAPTSQELFRYHEDGRLDRIDYLDGTYSLEEYDLGYNQYGRAYYSADDTEVDYEFVNERPLSFLPDDQEGSFLTIRREVDGRDLVYQRYAAAWSDGSGQADTVFYPADFFEGASDYERSASICLDGLCVRESAEAGDRYVSLQWFRVPTGWLLEVGEDRKTLRVDITLNAEGQESGRTLRPTDVETPFHSMERTSTCPPLTDQNPDRRIPVARPGGFVAPLQWLLRPDIPEATKIPEPEPTTTTFDTPDWSEDWEAPAPPGTYGGCVDATFESPGVVVCADGSRNRRSVEEATSFRGVLAESCRTGGPGEACLTDEECGAGSFCVEGANEAYGGCGCVDTCRTDSDCPAFGSCLDARTTQRHPECAIGSCASDADCASGECGVVEQYGFWQMGCRTDTDACRTDADCTGGDDCEPTTDGWVCRAYY